MPSFLVPRHVSTHRIAAIALYRALLQQSSKAPLQSQQRNELQNIIRNRVRQHQHVHSYRRLRLAFQAGYEAIDHLDGSVAGQDESTAHLVSLLEQAPDKVKTAPPRESPSRKEDSKQVVPRQEAASKPSDAIFARPRPLEELSGKRHVPVLYSAQQIPVLRLSKPQPQVLSQYIDKRIKTRQKRLDRMHAMERGAELGRLEDAWDEELLQQHSVRLGRNGNGKGFVYEPSWSEEFELAQDKVGDALSRETDKHKAMAEKMQGVVDREQELFDQERRERKERLRLERVERRKQRRVGKDEGEADEAAEQASG